MLPVPGKRKGREKRNFLFISFYLLCPGGAAPAGFRFSSVSA
jgi:hypothetical protein